MFSDEERPSTDFMERIQKDINSNLCAILIDWLVEVVEEYRLLPDTLYLTVNYIDRWRSFATSLIIHISMRRRFVRSTQGINEVAGTSPF
ncbi:hypothetical protein CRYUN_Cryun04dG0121200 [Craigia yunnanensis]